MGLIKRRYPIGAEFSKEGVHFRVWAPSHRKVTLVLENFVKSKIPLKKEENGYFSVFVPKLQKGMHYFFELDGKDKRFPDPASRYQPLGVEGPSCVVDPLFPWTDKNWPGVEIEGQIIYEMHIGTFTQEGTFKAAIKELRELARLGITLIELMPINEFPGQFGWGYDGVNLFAPFHCYGSPEDVKAFIDRAHHLGIGVLLDVVYNHLGPEGNFLPQFTPLYFHSEKKTDWGKAIHFDHPSVSEFFLTNARYWIEEFHFDGLRIDAVWALFSKGDHIFSELTKTVKKANPKKKKILIGEDEPQDVKLLKSYKEGGHQFDALWNDDFHHTAYVRLKGKREAYYTDYLGSPQEFISSLKYGFLYKGQYYSWQGKNRGTFELHIAPESMIIFLENHDQIANSSPDGRRLHEGVDFGNYKALATLLMLGPNTPMLFQGQEFGSKAPFHYFASYTEKLNQIVYKERKNSVSQFPRLSTKEVREEILKPSDSQTFIKCKLDFKERQQNSKHYALYKDLISLRRKDPVFKSMKSISIDGAVLRAESFLIRFFGGELGDRLLLINFGEDTYLDPVPEPLLAPGNGLKWEIIFSTESLKYGGEGVLSFQTSPWQLPGRSALILKTKGKL